ncbi:hypothetical protein CTM76_19195 [Photobacterium phosphoreum]|uniref:DUF5455 family protein n=1 Tax=Photobacterium phosphoreum TaxID=659 RepID=UPI0007F91BF8|nr:DUF5455 family protein [Photobacterium phosphoreum]OBU37508.1 hypothetical protein AYY25_17550 [Photobacterium phosphoreum]PSU75449.1 hypothetical protein CTM76_19195 [Photobacterium phosphoreum]
MIPLLPIVAAFTSFTRFGTLLSALLSVFISIFGWFLKFVAKKTAFNYAVIALVIGIALVAFLAIETVAFGISLAIPPDYSVALSLITPSNATACMSAIFACKTVRWFFTWQSWAIEMVAK